MDIFFMKILQKKWKYFLFPILIIKFAKGKKQVLFNLNEYKSIN